MAKSSPEKLAKALRANLKRRKGPTGQYGLEDGRAAKRAPEATGQYGLEDGRAAKRAPEATGQHGPGEGPRSQAGPGNQTRPELRPASEKPLKNSG